MPKITGSCHCEAVSFDADGKIAMQANCHCIDCQKITGACFATIVFVKKADIEISGALAQYRLTADSGNVLTKEFCPNCGSQLFTQNSGRDYMVGIQAGVINEAELIAPQVNVYCSRKIPTVPIDESLPAFDKMPS